jgi:hypothetical protein
MYNLPKLGKFLGKRELGKWFPSRSLETRMRGKGEKGKNLNFLLPPVFPARLKAIIAPKTLM